jgi:hypothetical protein
MKLLTNVLLIISLLSTAVTRAQEPKPASKNSSEQDVEVLKIDTNLVTVPVIASSRTGSYIADLKKEEFKLTEDGAAQEIAFLASVDAPFYVVLMLDTSNSTKEKLPLIQRAAIDFLEQIRPNDKGEGYFFRWRAAHLGRLHERQDNPSQCDLENRVGDSTRVYDARCSWRSIPCGQSNSARRSCFSATAWTRRVSSSALRVRCGISMSRA